MTRGASVFLSAVLVACGGGAAKGSATAEEATQSEEATEPPEQAEPEAAPSAAGEEKETPSTGKDSAGSAGAGASAEDLGKVLQLFVSDDELNRSLHLNKPGRFPLKLGGSDVPSDAKLTNGNEAVKIVGEPKSDKDPVLMVTKIETEPKSVTIGFRYDVEKIRGTARYKKGSFGWELASIRIVER